MSRPKTETGASGHRTTVRFPPEVWAQLVERASAEGVPVVRMVVQAVRELLKGVDGDRG